MNQFSQVKQNGLETFVTNLNNLYIELLIDDALRNQKKEEFITKIDVALQNNDKEAFIEYSNALKQLEDL